MSLPVRSWPASTWVLRLLVLALPLAALLAALPVWPGASVLLLVALGSLRWAWLPEDLAGPIVLLLVVAWWGIHGVVDWRLLVVAACLLGAHVAAVLASYGPGPLGVDRPLVMLWARRLAVAACPVPIAWLAVQGLDADLAPSWLWALSIMLVLGLLLVGSQATQGGTE